jgi:hypothetical protein
MRQGCSLSPLLFNEVLEFLGRVIRQENEIKLIEVKEEEVKLYLFSGDMILHQKDPYNNAKKSLRSYTFRRVARYKRRNFLYPSNEKTEKEINKIFLFTIASKN